MQVFERNVPEAFKSCFDTANRKIANNAVHPAKNYVFTKQKHIRGDKTLNKYHFGPNVMYFVGRAFSAAEASAKYKNSKLKKSLARHFPRAPLRNLFLPNIKK